MKTMIIFGLGFALGPSLAVIIAVMISGGGRK